MMNILTKKRGKKGFTLMELLIVVAIIAILVAISIPVFTNQLEKAREATDVANVRSAKALAVAEYLTDDTISSSASNVTYLYNAKDGTLVKDSGSTAATIDAYGRGTKTDGGVDTETGTVDHTKEIVQVEIDKDGNVKCTWVTGKTN